MLKIKLLTGLRRGNIASVAGELVEVEEGLARRLVERGQATLATPAPPVKATRAKATPAPAHVNAPTLEAAATVAAQVDQKEDAPDAPALEDGAEIAAPDAPAPGGDASE
jgi:hypothetical protein